MNTKEIETKLKKQEEDIKKLETLKATAKAQLTVYKKQFNDALKELADLGVDVKNLPEEKKKLEDEINGLVSELDKMLSDDIIAKYSQVSPDDLLDQKVLDSMDLDQDF